MTSLAHTAIAALTFAALAPHAASATPVAARPNVSFAATDYTLDLGGAAFTFSNTGDFFNPVAVATSGTATVAAFGGFLGIPLAPTSFFTDPGRAPFIDGGQQYAPFAARGVVASSLAPAYLALAFTWADGVHYGYAFTRGTQLVTFAYESEPGVGIQAPAVATSEPAAAALALLGVGALAVARRNGRGRA